MSGRQLTGGELHIHDVFNEGGTQGSLTSKAPGIRRILTMELRTLPIDQLRPAPYNPRIKLKPGDKAWERLERSLDEFSLVQPIVWNERTGHVVGGHQRLEILRHKGILHVDCVVVDLPLEKEKALNVTLNNANVGSVWDADKLLDLVSELHDLPDFDATLTGFDDQLLQDMLLRPDPAFTPSTSAGNDDRDKMVRVTLQIPDDSWEGVQGSLNELLAEYPAVRLHVSGQ